VVDTEPPAKVVHLTVADHEALVEAARAGRITATEGL
jgi:hypothetical protein